MKQLTIRCKDDFLTCEDNSSGSKKEVLIHVGYENLDNACEIFLTRAKAHRLRTWLNKWMKETQPKTKK